MLITDLTATLPHNGAWQRRTVAPDLLCIHHSVTPGDYPIARIAEYHIGRGYAGIAYHYVVDMHGKVYRTNDDMSFTWHGNGGNTGLGVCLLGDFTAVAPPEAQLAAAAELVVVLRAQYRALPVLGHRECARAQTACPGDTWPQWRARLAEATTPDTGATMTDWTRYPRPPDDTGAGVHGGANASFPLGDNDGLIPGMLGEMKAMGLRCPI